MSGRSRFPFTSSQWQELEHQALIFKYMASGIPVPPDLLLTIKRSCLDSSSVLPSKLFPTHHPQHVGWNCFQTGLGRKIDPEPGRCRRTDGKKWRCSKEAFPDSKYCERHMHRGKNRSRKPVEVLNIKSSSSSSSSSSCALDSNSSSVTPTTISSLTPKNNFSIITTNSNTTTSTQTPNSYNPQHPCYNNTHVFYHHHHHLGNPLLYHHQHNISSLRPHHGILGLSSQDSNSTSMLFDSDLRNRYVYGIKEEVDHDHHDHGHAFFSEEPSRSTLREDQDSWQLTPVLTMSCSSSSSSKQRSSCSGTLQLQRANYYNNERKEEEETQKTIHFFDEWPVVVKNQKDPSWLDLDDKKSSNSGSVSTTQLSISIPSTNSSYDFPIFRSRTTHHGD